MATDMERHSESRSSADDSPPDKGDKASLYAVISYVVVFLLLGVPLWWKTTNVYRVSLPFQQIEDLPSLPIIHKVHVKVIVGNSINVEELEKQLMVHSAEDVPSTKEQEVTASVAGGMQRPTLSYDWTIRRLSDIEQHIVDESSSIQDLDHKFQEQHGTSNMTTLKLVILPDKSPLLKTNVAVGAHRTVFLKNGNSQNDLAEKIRNLIRKTVVQEDKLLRMFGTSVLTKQTLKERMRSLGATPELDLVFSLIVPEPQKFDVRWNINQAIKDYLRPFLKKLSAIFKVDVKSQILYLTTLNVNPDYNAQKNEHIVTLDQLPLVINPLEAKLGSHVSTNPVLNFVVYVPPSYQLPFQIYLETGEKLSSNAFCSPRWGGFLIYNVDPISNMTKTPVTISVDMKHIMEVFLTQMKHLIGLSDQDLRSEDIEFLQNSDIISDWEVDYLVRLHTQEQVAQAVSSLTSLSQLLGTISNIVIQDDVGEEIYSAVSYIQESINLLQHGFLNEALHASTKAFLASERAFFDPSLLALLYFPDDQKYAIYIPLFLPVSIPVLISIRQLWKALRSSKSSSALSAESHEHLD